MEGELEMDKLTIAVEGCCHGELNAIYQSIRESEEVTKKKVDLLIICGDFEALRDVGDLNSLAVPLKYRHMNDFQEYIEGIKVAPILTIFVGGNHEASNYLQSLYFGGFVAPNIYFMGFASVIRFCGLRIGGLSGIYDEKHFQLGRFEYPPYNSSTMRSIYHYREYEFYQLSHLNHRIGALDIFISHDWPREVWEYGDKAMLLRFKPYFLEAFQKNELGCPHLMQLMRYLKPRFWFSAHHHVKFPAVVVHGKDDGSCDSSSSELLCPWKKAAFPVQHHIPVCSEVSHTIHSTRFLALDKVIPGRKFLQIIDVPVAKSFLTRKCLEFDEEWAAIQRKTHFYFPFGNCRRVMPHARLVISPEEIEEARMLLIGSYGSLEVPLFDSTMKEHNPMSNRLEGNIQTDRYLGALGLSHAYTVPSMVMSYQNPPQPTQELPDGQIASTDTSLREKDDAEIDIDDVEDSSPHGKWNHSSGNLLPEHCGTDSTITVVSNHPLQTPLSKDDAEIDIDDL